MPQKLKPLAQVAYEAERSARLRAGGIDPGEWPEYDDLHSSEKLVHSAVASAVTKAYLRRREGN